MQSVTRIYNYFKKYGYKTQVMGASFRRVDQIVRLAGCDLLTISPDLLQELANTAGELAPALTPEAAAGQRRAAHHARREDVPLAAQPGPDGRGEAVRRHPPVRRRRAEAGDVGEGVVVGAPEARIGAACRVPGAECRVQGAARASQITRSIGR